MNIITKNGIIVKSGSILTQGIDVFKITNLHVLVSAKRMFRADGLLGTLQNLAGASGSGNNTFVNNNGDPYITCNGAIQFANLTPNSEITVFGSFKSLGLSGVFEIGCIVNSSGFSGLRLLQTTVGLGITTRIITSADNFNNVGTTYFQDVTDPKLCTFAITYKNNGNGTTDMKIYQDGLLKGFGDQNLAIVGNALVFLGNDISSGFATSTQKWTNFLVAGSRLTDDEIFQLHNKVILTGSL